MHLPDGTNISCGIYMIKNTRNGKKYIGSTKHANNREKAHFSLLKKNAHRNQKLMNAWNAEPDASVFKFNMFIYCNVDDLKRIEQNCIDFMKPEYNISPMADRPTPFEFWPEEKQNQQRDLCRDLFSGDNNPSKNMTDEELSVRAAKGVATRRAKGTDISGAEKAKKTRIENGTNLVIGKKAAAARIANGTEEPRIEKMARTRKANGSFITGAAKGAATRKANGTDAIVVAKNAATRKEKGTDFFTNRNPSLTMTKEQLSIRGRKSLETLRWNKFKVILSDYTYFGA